MSAIQILGAERYQPAIKTLFNYLDFEEPLPPGVPHTAHLSPTGGIYPAADLLSNFGESIIPDLKKLMIRNDDAKKLARLNAAVVYFWLSHSPATVGFVAKTGHEAVDPESGKSLVELAGQMAKRCSTDKQEGCRQVLNAQ